MGRRKKKDSTATAIQLKIQQVQGLVVGDYAKVVLNFHTPRVLPTADEIRDACTKITRRSGESRAGSRYNDGRRSLQHSKGSSSGLWDRDAGSTL